MALADYRLCDICNGKAFYDSNLNYEFADKYTKIPADELIQQPKSDSMKLDYLGKWVVLCRECSKTHDIIIQKH